MRPHDVDSVSLPNRLLTLAAHTFSEPRNGFRRSQLITTRSIHIPTSSIIAPATLRSAGVTGSSVPALVTARLRSAGVPEVAIPKELTLIIAPSLLRGEQLDVNRPFGNGFDDNGNGVVDEPAEAPQGEAAWLPQLRGLPRAFVSSAFTHTNDDPLVSDPRYARQIFARHLYCLMMVLTQTDTASQTTDKRLRTARRLAQWAINVVDFRDPDSIMSPFEFDIDPLNGWQPMDGDVATDEGGERAVVWGCEYPEMIITETLAFHDRRVKDTDFDRGSAEKRQDDEGNPADNDLDQYRIPKGALFIELYNTRGPEISSSARHSPSELYDSDKKLDLDRVAPIGTDGRRNPVWRIVISSISGEKAIRDKKKHTIHPSDANVERIIWLTTMRPTGHPEQAKIYFNRRPGGAKLERGRYVVVGSGPVPGSGLLPDILPAAHPPANWIGSQFTAPSGITVSVSEPVPTLDYYPEPTHRSIGGLVDAYGLVTGSQRLLPDKPFDNHIGRPLAQLHVPTQGTVLDFRTAYLQRLANPLVPFDADRNPYLTVDWATIDLTVFNREDRQPSDFDISSLGAFDPGMGQVNTLSLRFGSRERGAPGGNVWDPRAKQPQERRIRSSPVDELLAVGPVNSLGKLNSVFRPDGGSSISSGPFRGAPAVPFPWLTWLDGPFVSPLKLMLVPKSEPSRLLSEFSIAAHFGPVGHLLDFINRSNDSNSHFYRLFDCVGVASPFVGTRTWFQPQLSGRDSSVSFLRPPFNHVSMFRDPGRVNVNTVFDPLVWKSMVKGYPGMDSPSSWSNLVKSREGFGGQPAHRFPTQFANPFRSGTGGELVPLRVMRKPAVEATVLRSRPDNTGHLLFSVDSTTNSEAEAAYRNQNRNAYFYYEGLHRLGNLITTRSNVFAVWITLGYFEVRPHPEGYRLSQEIGSDIGQVRRHRAFYVIDRSIPVAFEPGRSHNVDRAVLIRRFIE